jgi:hypothetical protein
MSSYFFASFCWNSVKFNFNAGTIWWDFPLHKKIGSILRAERFTLRQLCPRDKCFRRPLLPEQVWTMMVTRKSLLLPGLESQSFSPRSATLPNTPALRNNNNNDNNNNNNNNFQVAAVVLFLIPTQTAQLMCAVRYCMVQMFVHSSPWLSKTRWYHLRSSEST